jgi:hypothetical protein
MTDTAKNEVRSCIARAEPSTTKTYFINTPIPENAYYETFTDNELKLFKTYFDPDGIKLKSTLIPVGHAYNFRRVLSDSSVISYNTMTTCIFYIWEKVKHVLNKLCTRSRMFSPPIF